tara:strand:+ start:136 stop:1215 length:1080 start_codon:yes stop_codon:yes gene_type:complete
MDISNNIRKYAECISSGAITEPTGGSWISAIAIWQGSTEPLNVSWLQRHCDNLGITQPVDGSWLIALSFYYQKFTPTNGSWTYSIQLGCEAGPPAPVDLIWDQTTSEWQAEEAAWAIGVAPMQPTFDQDGDTFSDPVLVLSGTGDIGTEVDISLNGIMYFALVDALGVWTVTTAAKPGAPSPGLEYTVTAIAKDLTTGLISSEFQGNLYVLQSSKVYSFELFSDWSLEWYFSGIQVEQELTPGMWAAIEYNGNPTWQNGNINYKVQPWISAGTVPGISNQNVISYQDGDEALPGIPTRFIELDAGYNYRIVGASRQASPTYGRFQRYTVYDDQGVIFLPEYDGEDADYVTGTVQQTFTL